MTRLIDTGTYTYQVGRAYQIRLERSDLDNPTMLAKLAKEAQTTPDEFRRRFLQAATRLPDQ